MASYVISTDTSCDFPLDYVQRHQIPLVSLYYSIDGKDGVNGCPKSEELKTFYQKMREGAETKTQQASVETPKSCSARFWKPAAMSCTSPFLRA